VKRSNKNINGLFKNIRIIPVCGKGQGAQIFEAYSRAVADLGFGESEVFGVREIPDSAETKTGEAKRV
jgi:hypothetical protein